MVCSNERSFLRTLHVLHRKLQQVNPQYQGLLEEVDSNNYIDMT